MIRMLLDLLHPAGGLALVFGLDSRRASREIRARLQKELGLSPDVGGAARAMRSLWA
jgi:hypothetical protein